MMSSFTCSICLDPCSYNESQLFSCLCPRCPECIKDTKCLIKEGKSVQCPDCNQLYLSDGNEFPYPDISIPLEYINNILEFNKCFGEWNNSFNFFQTWLTKFSANLDIWSPTTPYAIVNDFIKENKEIASTYKKNMEIWNKHKDTWFKLYISLIQQNKLDQIKYLTSMEIKIPNSEKWSTGVLSEKHGIYTLGHFFGPIKYIDCPSKMYGIYQFGTTLKYFTKDGMFEKEPIIPINESEYGFKTDSNNLDGYIDIIYFRKPYDIINKINIDTYYLRKAEITQFGDDLYIRDHSNLYVQTPTKKTHFNFNIILAICNIFQKKFIGLDHNNGKMYIRYEDGSIKRFWLSNEHRVRNIQFYEEFSIGHDNDCLVIFPNDQIEN